MPQLQYGSHKMGKLYNQTNSTNFLLEVPDGNLTEAFKLNLQSAAVPGIHIPITDVPGSSQGLHRASLPGSTIEFDPVPCRFLVDENLDSWTDMYKWMISCNNYINRDNSGWNTKGFPDAVLMHILDSDKKDIVMTVRYIGAWCSDLSEIEYNLSEEGDPAMICIATLNYKYLEIEKDGIIVQGRKGIIEAKNQIYSDKIAKHPSMR